MNKALTHEIVCHVLSNLGVLNKDLKENFFSLLSSEYKLKEKITFQDSDIKNNIWGIETKIQDSHLVMLLADCTQDSNFQEYAFLIKLSNRPAHCFYASYGDFESEPLIAIALDKLWVPCNPMLQAMFLSSMEQCKEITSWSKASSYKEEYESLMSFIEFHHTYYEALEE